MIEFRMTQIGVIHTPYTECRGTPIQPKTGRGEKGLIEVFEQFSDGLRDLDGFSHIILIYYLHLSEDYSLKVIPYLDSVERGLFATRAPKRPSPIGLSTVRLTAVEGNVLHIEDLDIVDGTPLLDIKPYVPAFDEIPEFKIGWLQARLRDADGKRADDRF